ncbi:unnamed protein product [Darwinula stevensoni]|uniref:Peptidase S1 domain-containing protein n=1 Tax=Darwinula stevensoni TaxID=69355 RepID=A0A7R9A2S5_9CRUS|nr:unnamed protein product [Darwinula stevensoni]CAG0886266.1 unnamed protein product [Darwinula stevensoni]
MELGFLVSVLFLSVFLSQSSSVAARKRRRSGRGGGGKTLKMYRETVEDAVMLFNEAGQFLKEIPLNGTRFYWRTHVDQLRQQGPSAEREDAEGEGMLDLFADLYGPWSTWSKCNRRCRQKRVRHCLHAHACPYSRLKEERACRGGKCNPVRRGGEVRIYWHFDTLFFSQWSMWSPCTRSCTTRRYRACLFPLICGRNVLTEEAYCYVEGSACETWFKNRTSRNSFLEPGEDEEGTEGGEEDVAAEAEEDPPAKHEREGEGLGPETEEECGSNNVTSPDLRIIGGRVARHGKWPWQVAILNRFKSSEFEEESPTEVLSDLETSQRHGLHPTQNAFLTNVQEVFCGGTLVSRSWVLTAAHCVRKKLLIRLGESNLLSKEGTETEIKVEVVPSSLRGRWEGGVEDHFIHPDYDPETVDGDVALLRLPSPVKLNKYRRLACLPDAGDRVPESQLCTIIGWGKERNTNLFGTDQLREAEVPVVPGEMCKDVYQDYSITENMFCAGYKRGRVDSCAGDSGGPLLCQIHGKWTIYGITSFGEGCGRKGKFGIYAKVPNYVAWIKSVIKHNS